MPDRTPEQAGREAGRAMADSLVDAFEGVFGRLDAAVGNLENGQRDLSTAILALSRRIDALERMLHARTDHLA